MCMFYLFIYLNNLKPRLLQSVVSYASIRSELHLTHLFVNWVKFHQSSATGPLSKWNEIRVMPRMPYYYTSKIALNFWLHYLKSLEEA